MPEGPYETVAGLVADLLGRIPAPGDRAELPGWKLSVRQVGRNRAERVRLVRLGSVPVAAHGTAPEAARATVRIDTGAARTGPGRQASPAGRSPQSAQSAQLEGAGR